MRWWHTCWRGCRRRRVVPDALLVEPALLAGISDLDLIARRVVDGLVSGLHRSPFHGFSAEFHQYRHYRPGDDVKHVDWKLFARTDRLYTKQFQETTNLPASFVIDTSASMGFAGSGPLTKLRYAVVLAAALSHLLARKGDQVALLLGDGGAGRYLAPRGGRVHQRAILHALAAAEAAGPWPAAAAVRAAALRMARRGLVFVFTDLYDDEASTLAELRHAVSMGHDVALFHVLTRDEVTLTAAGVHEFEDVETGATREVDATAMAGPYTARVRAFLDEARTTAQAGGIDYSLVDTRMLPQDVLRRFLVRQPGVGRTP